MGLRVTYYLASDPSRKYTLTDGDILWLARALYGEAGDPISRRSASAIAWCLINRYLMWGSDFWEGKSFTEFMRAFSQPINPIWTDPNSSKCLGQPKDCTPERIARRRMIQGAAWEDLPYSAKLYATTFAQGDLFQVLPNDIVDFSSCKRIERGIDVGGNCFLSKSETNASWKTGPVLYRVDPDATPVPSTYPGTQFSLITYVAIGAWLTLTGWAVLKLLK